ncbi:MAG: hypothetical protein ACE5NP_13915, partial [Anaerolineae bacterium]
KPGRYTVRLVGGRPSKLVTPEGREGPVIQISYPLPQAARRQLPFQAAHTLMEKPDVLGFVAVDADNAVRGVVPAERLRRLIVRAIEATAEEAQREVAADLGLEEKLAAEVIREVASLRGFAFIPGPPGPAIPPVTLYVCPQEACDTAFIPQQEGVPIPDCPHHKCALIEKTLGG